MNAKGDETYKVLKSNPISLNLEHLGSESEWYEELMEKETGWTDYLDAEKYRSSWHYKGVGLDIEFEHMYPVKQRIDTGKAFRGGPIYAHPTINPSNPVATLLLKEIPEATTPHTLFTNRDEEALNWVYSVTADNPEKHAGAAEKNREAWKGFFTGAAIYSGSQKQLDSVYQDVIQEEGTLNW